MTDIFTDVPGIGLPVAAISLASVRRNWRILNGMEGGAPPLAVVKADAYGHGIVPVTKSLLGEGCAVFAVGSVQEGVFLRKSLGDAGSGVTILPLLGLVAAEDAALCVHHNLIPLVQSAEGAAWIKNAYTGKAPLPIAVKVETGMSRLGFRQSTIQDIVETLRSAPNLAPAYLLSHLASADEPAKETTVREQAVRFMDIFAVFHEFWPGIIPSLANSAGFMAGAKLLDNLPPHMGRPGYALYGGNPFEGTAWEELGTALTPAMRVYAPVLGVHALAKGARVSYGGTFIAPKDMRIAVIGAGYSDCFPRALSGRGRVSINGAQCPVIGRVCMQMHMADVSAVPDVACGDKAYLLGDAVSMKDVAADWGTIPYEVLCLLGKNTRHYESGS
ncbi:MAG: Alanine racemase [Desulfovibrio sp.]